MGLGTQRGVQLGLSLAGGWESQNAQEKVSHCRTLIVRQRAKFILGKRGPPIKCKGLEGRGKRQEGT